MPLTRSLLGTFILGLALGAPLAAQDRAIRLSARGGGFNALTNLDEAGTADFQQVGYNLGGGIGVQLSRFVTLRGDFTYARNELRTNGLDTGDRLNRFFYDAAVQLQYPTSSGFEPYLFAGGGAVTLDEAGPGGQSDTKGAGTFGLGLNYTIPGSGVGFFLEGKSWLYKAGTLTAFPAASGKTQLEIGWAGGISYRLPL